MRRFAIFSIVIFTAVLLQTTLFAPRSISLFGVSPDLLLVVVISISLLEGPMTGAVSAFGGGLLRDLLLDAPKGLTGLSYLLVAYTIGAVRPYVQSTSVFVSVAAVFVGSLSGTILYAVLNILLGQSPQPMGEVLSETVLVAVYNTLLVPFVHPTVRKVTSLYRNEKVYRW